MDLLACAGAASADPRVLRTCIAHVFADLVVFVARRVPADAERVAAHLEIRAAVIDQLVPLR